MTQEAQAGPSGARPRRPPGGPPLWLMGLTTASYGMIGGAMLITTPQLLAAIGAPEPQIAWVTGVGLLPGSLAFLLSPLLDIRLKRRTYAFAFALLSAVLMVLAFHALRNRLLLGALLFLSNLATTLFLGAQSGWLGGLLPDAERSRLAAWSTVGNIGGGGVFAMLAIPLLRSTPFTLGAMLLGALILLPLAPLAFIPAPDPDPRLSSERWGPFIQDLRGLLAQPQVLRLMLVFVSPAASFALANTLAGLGAQFHASERFVGLMGGVGVLFAGAFGSLIVPPLAARIPPERLYLLVGSFGALFTLCLMAIPRTPASLGLAMVGENVFQAAAYATMFTLAFRSLGEANPLAATQMSLMGAASTLPITYMQVLDGHAYGAGGVVGACAFDGLVSLLACGGLFLFIRGRRSPKGAAPSGGLRPEEAEG